MTQRIALTINYSMYLINSPHIPHEILLEDFNSKVGVEDTLRLTDIEEEVGLKIKAEKH
jgi:hypothetical protein